MFQTTIGGMNLFGLSSERLTSGMRYKEFREIGGCKNLKSWQELGQDSDVGGGR